MASGKPIVRQIAWISIIPQLLFMAILYVIYSIFIESIFLALYFTCITYLFISLILKLSMQRNQRKGIVLSKAGKYEQAIEEFQKSYAFFSKHNWIDKYRFITLLSSSKVSYREMALLNIAFCYSQIKDGKNSKTYYLKTIEQFPNSEIAHASLKMIEAIESHDKHSE